MADAKKIDSDDSKSPAELEAEIAAAASELGGKSPKEKKAAEPAKKKQVAKPAAKPAKSTKATKPAADSEEHKLTVRVEKKPSAAKIDEDAGEEKASTDPTDEPVVIKHSGKTISPLSDKKAKVTPAKKTKEEPEKPEEPPTKPAEEVVAEQEVNDSIPDEVEKTEAKEEPKEDAPQSTEATNSDSTSDEAGSKLAAMTGELKAREAEKAAKKEGDQQVAKVYDTKKYHLPIKASRHHRRSSMPMWLQITTLIIAVAVALVYGWSTDLFDFGRPSLFDDSSSSSTDQSDNRAVTVAENSGTSIFNLLPNADSVGSAVADVAVYYDDDNQGELISQKLNLVHNKSGTFWFEQDSTLLQTTNDFLRSKNIPDDELAQSKIGLDFIDIYGFTNLITAGGPGSLNSSLDGLSGDAATSCQQAFDSTLVSLSTELFSLRNFTVTGSSQVTVTHNGNSFPADQFTLSSTGLSSARDSINTAAKACVEDSTERSKLLNTLWADDDIRYTVSNDDTSSYIKVENLSLNRVVALVNLSSINAEKSEASPEIIQSANQAVSRLVAAVSTCQNELPLQLTTGDEEPELLGSGDDGYQTVPEFDRVLVCSDSANNISSLSGSDLGEKAQNAVSLRSLIEVSRDELTGYPTEAELEALIQQQEPALPVPANSQDYSYSVSPDNCGQDEACGSFILTVSQ